MALSKADKDHVRLAIYEAFESKVEAKLIPLVKNVARHEGALFGITDENGHIISNGVIANQGQHEIEIKRLRKSKWIIYGIIIALAVFIPLLLKLAT